jgi:CheY-like chemotaxis protein
MQRATDISPTRRLRALVLDGDSAARRAVRRALEASGFEVRCAADGDTGIGVLLDELLALDVLVADAELPGRDARALADLVRRAGGERDLALVVVAGAPAPGLREELLALGVDAVVERRAGGEGVAAAALDAVAARRPDAEDAAVEAPARPARPEPRPAASWPSPFAALALADA